MTWVLIIILFYSRQSDTEYHGDSVATAITTTEFNSEASCRVAEKWANNNRIPLTNNAIPLTAKCFQK